MSAYHGTRIWLVVAAGGMLLSGARALAGVPMCDTMDCNENLLFDYCEVQDPAWCDPLSTCNCDAPISCSPAQCVLDFCAGEFTAASDEFAPVLWEESFTFTIFNAPDTVNDVQLDFEAYADLYSSDRYVVVKMNGTDVGHPFADPTGHNSCGPPNTDTIFVDEELYNETILAPEFGGNVVMTLTPSVSVTQECRGGSYVTVTMTHRTVEDCNINDIPDECDLADCVDDPACDDCNDNGILDECDIADCPGGPACNDCNENGIPDGCELVENDCNGNGIPDDCEPGGLEDCNNNGIPDLCDIYFGTSTDCNGNDIPDECEIANCQGDPGCDDCNGNGLPDECDIDDCQGDPDCGDCNENDIPDGCEPDCDEDDVPDECEADPVLAVGCRYLEITPLAGDMPDPFELHRILVSWSCGSGYVGEPDPITGISRLVPLAQAAAKTTDDWCTVYVGDEEIVPSTVYSVVMVNAADPGDKHPLGGDETWLWGDATNNGVVDLDDILCVLSGFSDIFEPPCSFLGDDLASCVPNAAIDLDDILAVLSAFAEDPFPCDPLCE